MKKLTYENNWESDIYKVDGKRLRYLNKVKIGSKTYNVIPDRVGVSYSEMGRTDVAYSTHYFVKEKVFGLPTMFDLNTIVPRKAVYAVEYETE